MRAFRLIAFLTLLASAAAFSAPIAEVETIRLNDVRLTGPDLLDEAQIESLVAPLRGREVTFAQLMRLSHQLTEAIVARGYVNSGVVVPDQKVDGGIIEMRVIPGTLTTVEVSGNKQLSDERIAGLVNAAVSVPFNVNDLSAAVDRLQRHRLVEFVNGHLTPGLEPGQGMLFLDVRETPKRTLSISGDNYRSPAIDEHQASFSITDASLTGRGDELVLSANVTDGAEDYYASYALPIGPWGGVGRGYYSDRQLDIVEEPFDELDIRTDTQAWGLMYTHPLIDEASKAVSLFGSFENEQSQSKLLGLPFSFSRGEDNGESETTSATLGIEWAQRFGPQRFALRGAIQQGLELFDATENPGDLPDTNFTLFLGQAQYLRDLGWRSALLSTRITFQLTEDALLPQHKIPVGGRYSVRGYRENQLVRDNGVFAQAEIRVPVDPGQTLSLVTFIDYGRAWDELDILPSSSAEDLASIGFGFMWTPLSGLYVEGFYADDLEDMDNPTSTNQERGFHYQLRYDYRF